MSNAELLIDSRIVRRILRVNHAGEHGAVSIYSAQIRRVAAGHPELKFWLGRTLEHETRHRARFLAAMPSRGAKPCRLLAVWSTGGWVLGYSTSLLGPFGVMVCTAAVERTVHRHLVEQIDFLKARDPELAALILEIQKDEDEHLDHAERNHDPNHWFARILSAFVAVATELLIWLSTRGDSTRLSAELKERT